MPEPVGSHWPVPLHTDPVGSVVPASKGRTQVPLLHTAPLPHVAHALPKRPQAPLVVPGWHTPF